VSSPLYDCSDEPKRQRGIGSAVRAIKRGALIVIPTDTVYGIGADAFSSDGVASLLKAKGRGRGMPVPVLVGAPETLGGIAAVTPAAQALVDAFWPGALTIVLAEQPSLAWDLGDAGGTVAVRMPSHEIALEVLNKTGPMAVSSANISGQAPARTAREARDQLGDNVAAYLEAGETDDDVPSTIVDCTREMPQVLRPGAISLAELREVVPDVVAVDEVLPEMADADSEGDELNLEQAESGEMTEPGDADGTQESRD
jgi:tRNA threonylcarbamoyl adenosine modification protein (Sua5/YciO/YrdC/YwlC family)